MACRKLPLLPVHRIGLTLLLALVMGVPATATAFVSAQRGLRAAAVPESRRPARKPAARSARTAELGPHDFYLYEHRIRRGDTVSGVAKRYGVTIEQVLSWNDLISPHLIREGNTLVIYSKRRFPRHEQRQYEVKQGDTLGKIARVHKMTVPNLRRLNRLRGDIIHPGQKLVVEVERPPVIARLGGGRGDYLKNAIQLTSGAGYRVRNRSRAWGTPNTVRQIQQAFRALRSTHGKYTLLIADLSTKNGGPLGGHRSHQRGLDVDIAIYRKGVRDYKSLTRTTPSTIDAERTWALLHQFIRQGQVEMIFINHTLQRPLYEEARRRGATAKQLAEWFQYPASRNTRRGVIRHEPGHDGHIHIRFLDFDTQRTTRGRGRGGRG